MNESAALRSILVVEDDPDTAGTLEMLLRRKGFSVRTAICREDALSVVQSLGVEVILMDYFMPGLSAATFVTRVQAAFPTVRIIPMSAATHIVAIARMLGLSEYLGKPIEPDILFRVLSNPA